jgi:hypothetical protein
MSQDKCKHVGFGSQIRARQRKSGLRCWSVPVAERLGDELAVRVLRCGKHDAAQCLQKTFGSWAMAITACACAYRSSGIRRALAHSTWLRHAVDLAERSAWQESSDAGPNQCLHGAVRAANGVLREGIADYRIALKTVRLWLTEWSVLRSTCVAHGRWAVCGGGNGLTSKRNWGREMFATANLAGVRDRQIQRSVGFVVCDGGRKAKLHLAFS